MQLYLVEYQVLQLSCIKYLPLIFDPTQQFQYFQCKIDLISDYSQPISPYSLGDTTQTEITQIELKQHNQVLQRPFREATGTFIINIQPEFEQQIESSSKLKANSTKLQRQFEKNSSKETLVGFKQQIISLFGQMEEQLLCTSETIQPLVVHSADSPEDNKTKQESIRYKRTLVKQKKKVKKITKDIRCKKKRFQTNIILKHAQNDISELNIQKNTENSLILYKDKSQMHEESHIFRPIVLRSIYFIAGDIIIEPRDTLNGEERIRHLDIFNNFRNITSVESCKNFLQFTMESVKPLLNLEEIIYCLENSQDTSNYEYAQSLRRYQPAVLLVEDLINKVINQYNQNPSDLEELLKKREAYIIEQQNKLLEELGNQGAFASVCMLSLSFRNKTIQSTHLSLTKQSIGFLGADFNSMHTYLLRQGFINFLNHQSRRMVFSSTIEHFADFKSILQFTLPSFEILTADGIRFACDCDVSCKSVEFPEGLQFKGAEVKKLNNIESINVMKFTITPKIVRSVLEIREATPSNFADKLELFCFEYAMRSSILLDKYYPDLNKHPNRFLKDDSKQTQCGYRRIHNPDSQIQQSTEE